MSKQGHQQTKAAYENPDVVQGYILEHSISPKMPISLMEEFAGTLPGKRLLDLGCGPGHDSYRFVEMGLEVTGVDYSKEMIEAAKALTSSTHPPKFIVADMLDLSQFKDQEFDGIWACASLVHLAEVDLPLALSEIFRLTTACGKVFLCVKGGAQTEELVEENKYGPLMLRRFTLWDKEVFDTALLKAGFIIEVSNVDQVLNRQKTRQTIWLNYWLSKDGT